MIAPPSLRPGKGYYRWLNEGTPVADAPDWLLTLIASVGRRPENDPLPEWLQEIIKGDCGKGTSADANDLRLADVARSRPCSTLSRSRPAMG